MDRHEVQKALDWFAREHFARNANPNHAEISDLIFKLALAHPKIVSRWIGDFCYYRDAENLPGELLLAARIAEQPEYKKRMVKGGAK